MEAQRPVGQRPQQMVAPVDMKPLVEEDIVPLPFPQIRGQVDPWPQDAQHKGRGDMAGQINPLPQRHGGTQPQQQPEIRRCRPDHHGCRACKPDPGGNCPDIRLGLFCLGRSRLHRTSSIFRRCGHIRGIDRGQVGDGAHGLPRLHGRHVRPGKERRRRGKRHRAQQPEEYNAPQRIRDSLGRMLERQAHKKQQQNHRAGHEAHIENLGKDAGHGASSPRMPSIMDCSAAISSEESFFREEKAARKAGSEP